MPLLLEVLLKPAQAGVAKPFGLFKMREIGMSGAKALHDLETLFQVHPKHSLRDRAEPHLFVRA